MTPRGAKAAESGGPNQTLHRQDEAMQTHSTGDKIERKFTQSFQFLFQSEGVWVFFLSFFLFFTPDITRGPILQALVINFTMKKKKLTEKNYVGCCLWAQVMTDFETILGCLRWSRVRLKVGWNQIRNSCVSLISGAFSFPPRTLLVGYCLFSQQWCIVHQ